MSNPSTRLLELLVDTAGKRAEEALDCGALSVRPDRIIAYVSVADCTSRLLPTVRSRLYDKVRRVASAVRRTADATALRSGQPPPAVELRLRHSAMLLAGHPPGSWSVLVHTLNAAARDAGIDRVTGPLVTWGLLDVCGLVEHVLPAAERVVFRADVGNHAHPSDIRGLALTLPLAGNGTAVVSSGAWTCPDVHPEAIEIRGSGHIPALTGPDPVLFRAASAVLAEQCVRFTQEMTADQPAWHAGLPGVDLEEAQFHLASAPRDFAWTSAGWPLSRNGTNRLYLGPNRGPNRGPNPGPGSGPDAVPDAEALARGLSTMLAPFSAWTGAASGGGNGGGGSSAGARYVVIDTPPS